MPVTALLPHPSAQPERGLTGRGPWTQNAPLHPCPFPGCRRKIHRFMCKPHWYMIDKTARDEIWRSWDDGRATITPGTTALAVVSAARTYLAAS